MVDIVCIEKYAIGSSVGEGAANSMVECLEAVHGAIGGYKGK